MRHRRSEFRAIHISAALAITLLMGASPYLAPSGAQSPKAESCIVVPPAQPSDFATEQPPIASDRPTIDLEFPFTDDLTDDAVKSQPQITALATALSSQGLKGSTFVIACHTAASGGAAADQALSARCTDTVQRVLVEKFGLAAETLVAVGYGSSKPKNLTDPSSIENQRLEIVNMNTK